MRPPLCFILAASLSGSLMLLPGCGSTAKVAKGAKDDVEAAQRALESANSANGRGEYRTAVAEYERAQTLINTAKLNATDSEKRTLKDMDNTVSSKVSVARTMAAKEGDKKAPPPPPSANTSNVAKSEDPEVVKQRLADEKKKLEAAELATKNAAIDAREKARNQALTSTVKKDDEEPAEKTAGLPKRAGAEGEVADGAEGAEPAADAKGGVISPASAPFAAVTKDTPEILIPKLQARGKYIMGYVQVRNTTPDERRIAAVVTYFKDANGSLIVEERQVIAYQFDGFKAENGDPTTQDCPGLTMGSHAIEPDKCLRFVVVAEHHRAADVKKVGILVAFQRVRRSPAAAPTPEPPPEVEKPAPKKRR